MKNRISRRKQIREKAKQTLMDKTPCGIRVFANRFTPLWDVELPLIAIYTMDEPASVWAEAPREFERKLRLAIEIVGEGREDKNTDEIVSVDDILDDVGQAVEDAFAQDHTLGELCRDVVLTNTEFMVDPNAEKSVASLRLTYEVTYYTVEVAIDETTELPDLKKVGNTWRAGQEMEIQDAGQDLIEFPVR